MAGEGARPGGFVLIVGPSGAGKDTLIRLARAALADEPRFVFPRRLVTRPPSAHEDNDEIDEAAFAAGEAAGRFALSWRAHGLGYGVPGETLRLAEAGHVVACNVSRRAVAAARTRLPRVSVVGITAPPEILARRLAARARAEDGDLAARLARQAPDPADLTIVNDGSPEEGAARLVAHLRSR
ncbi:phosphonate metabolism protein/1,5-bisphosphokinase (PRPP-forming) PhnN [Methylobacterium sp. JK268]